MKRYRETLILVVVIILIGGGIYFLQMGGVIGDEDVVGGGIGPSPLRNCVSDLEQIARLTHDYLNGYLSGANFGTALPPDLMEEEIDQLFYKYQLVVDAVVYLYPQGAELDPLLDEFDRGFAEAVAGIKKDDIKLLTEAHRLFHRIDYQVFHHKWTDEVAVSN